MAGLSTSRVKLAALFCAILTVFGVASANAQIVIGAAQPSDFSETDVLITFDTIADDVEITTQFAGLGVTFTGLFGQEGNFENFGDGSGNVAGNFQGNVCPVGGCVDTILEFSTSITRVGFEIATGGPPAFITVMQGAGGPGAEVTILVLMGPHPMVTFFGIAELTGSGFDRVV